jgi:hypothetical protein
MTEAERLAHECAVAVLNRNDDVQAVLEYFRQYGRLVQEAAAKESAKPEHGVSAWKCRENITKAIREMDLP